MNSLRSSNIIELRVSDIHDAEIADEYPGYMVFTNSRYKTSTIYGGKLMFCQNGSLIIYNIMSPKYKLI